jgi:hypothetical protein
METRKYKNHHYCPGVPQITTDFTKTNGYKPRKCHQTVRMYKICIRTSETVVNYTVLQGRKCPSAQSGRDVRSYITKDVCKCVPSESPSFKIHSLNTIIYEINNLVYLQGCLRSIHRLREQLLDMHLSGTPCTFG